MCTSVLHLSWTCEITGAKREEDHGPPSGARKAPKSGKKSVEMDLLWKAKALDLQNGVLSMSCVPLWLICTLDFVDFLDLYPGFAMLNQ